MSDRRRARAKEILQSALAKTPDERTQFLREACRDDPTLIPEVESLLASYDRVGGILKSSDSDPSPGKGGSGSRSVPGKAGSQERSPRRIGKYEVLQRVGQGAMGVVYKARDPLMRRLVGIKTMSAEIATDPELHDRFYREARSAGNLSHKNIITIYDLGEEGGQPYIAMEYLEGEDLKSKLYRRVKLTLEERLQWMLETCEGLAHAHAKEIIHRDIKPGNIFITQDGQAKILDFGLARLTSSVATKTGLVMGTPSYMSPEQVQAAPADYRSDLYSAGATFYELLTFRKPFSGESIHALFFQILESNPPAISEINSWIPTKLVDAVARAMAKDPKDRFQSAMEFLTALRKISARLPELSLELRADTLETLGRLDSLFKKYQSLLETQEIPLELAEDSIDLPATADPAESPTIAWELPADYLGLADTITRARGQHQRLQKEIEKLEAAMTFIEEAASLEARGELQPALDRAELVLDGLPRHPGAARLVDRISKRLAESSVWKESRVNELLSQAAERYKDESFARAQNQVERLLALDPDNGSARQLTGMIELGLERQRRDRKKAKQADELVRSANAKLQGEDNPQACLQICRQALELSPEHSGARDLRERAKRRLAQQKALAAEETAIEALASATQALQQKNFALAEQEIERAEKALPELSGIPAATQQLERARQEQVRTLVDKAKASIERGDFRAAQQEITGILEIDPNHREATVLAEQARAGLAARRTADPARRPEARAAAGTPSRERGRPALWILGGGTVAVLLFGSLMAWRSLRSSPASPAPTPPPSSTIGVTAPVIEVTSSVPLASTSVLPTTTTPVPVTTVRPTSSVELPATTTSLQPVPETTTIPVTTSIQTTTTLATTTTAPVLTPRQQIGGLMQQYEAAYETLDVGALGAIYPSVPIKVIESFGFFESLKLELEVLSAPTVSTSTAGPTATATYRITQTMEPKVGKTTRSQRVATFHYAGIGANWIIIRIDWGED